MDDQERVRIQLLEKEFDSVLRTEQECRDYIAQHHADLPPHLAAIMLKTVMRFNRVRNAPGDTLSKTEKRLRRADQNAYYSEVILQHLPENLAAKQVQFLRELRYYETYSRKNIEEKGAPRTMLGDFWEEGLKNEPGAFKSYLESAANWLSDHWCVDASVIPTRLVLYTSQVGSLDITIEVYTDKEGKLFGVGYQES